MCKKVYSNICSLNHKNQWKIWSANTHKNYHQLVLSTSVTRCWNSKWPNFFKSCPKCCQISFCIKRDAFQNSSNVTVHLGYFWNKIFHPELKKIAQSGHNALNSRLGLHIFLQNWPQTHAPTRSIHFIFEPLQLGKREFGLNNFDAVWNSTLLSDAFECIVTTTCTYLPTLTCIYSWCWKMMIQNLAKTIICR